MQRLFLLLSVCLLSACHNPQTSVDDPYCETPMGVLFFVKDTTGMGQVIQASTGVYTHVAVSICTDSGEYLWEATRPEGVICRPLLEALNSWWFEGGLDTTRAFLDVVTMRQITVPFDTLRLLASLQSFLGQPYDDFFLPDNGRMYCSELIYESFYDLSGNRLFEAKPMNFRAADGSMPPYWTHYFDSLGVVIPEGVPGTNPTDMISSPHLARIRIE